MAKWALRPGRSALSRIGSHHIRCAFDLVQSNPLFELDLVLQWVSSSPVFGFAFFPFCIFAETLENDSAAIRTLAPKRHHSEVVEFHLQSPDLEWQSRECKSAITQARYSGEDSTAAMIFAALESIRRPSGCG